MDAATIGFAVFLVLSLAAAVLLVRQVIRGVRGGYSAAAGMGEGRYFYSELGDEGVKVMGKGVEADAD